MVGFEGRSGKREHLETKEDILEGRCGLWFTCDTNIAVDGAHLKHDSKRVQRTATAEVWFTLLLAFVGVRVYPPGPDLILEVFDEPSYLTG